MRWAYGITTVPKRRAVEFARTLASLRAGGFDAPRIFLDDTTHAEAADYERAYGLEVTARVPRLWSYGNWILALAELYIRQYTAERYAIFQDDLVTTLGLREYLSGLSLKDEEYWNLYSFPENEALAKGRQGFYPSNQRGRGAVALVFTKKAVQTLMMSQHMVERPVDVKLSETGVRRGLRNIDGGVIQTAKNLGWVELVHAPSLVQHTGLKTSMKSKRVWPLSNTFPGEGFDARTLAR